MIAAVSVVLPWSMWPIVPMLTCGLVRSNFFFAIAAAPSLLLRAGWTGQTRDFWYELGRQIGGDLGVVGQLHRVAGPALGHRPQVGGVAEHLRQRDSRPDDLRGAARLHRLDVAAASVEVADDVAEELLRHGDLDPHERLEDHRRGLGGGFLEGHRGGDAERHLARVDLVEGPVEERHLDVDHRVPGVRARLERLADAHVDRLDVLARDDAADDLVDELVALAVLVGLDLDDDVAVLALAAGLLDVAVVALRGAADRLPVGHVRPADVGRDLELADHAVDEDVQVQLAHAGDSGLAALLVRVDAEGGVFLGQALQGQGELVLVGLGLGLDGDLDDRLGEDDRLEHDRVVRIAQRVAGVGFLEADGGGDVAGVDRLDLLAVVGVHLEDAADPLLLALGGVEDVRAGVERARVDPEVGQLADVRVRRDLEGQGAERLAVVGGAEDLLVRDAGARR